MSYTQNEKLTMKAGWVSILVGAALYCVISWVLSAWMDGGAKEFLWILIAMIGLRIAYEFVDFVGGVIVWRVYGRRKAVAHFLEIMQKANLPMRCYCHDRIDDYLHRIESEDFHGYRTGEIKAEAKKTAAELNHLLMTVSDQHGAIAEARTWDAMGRALKIHSPDDMCPQWVGHDLINWLNGHDGTISEREVRQLPGVSPGIAKDLLARLPFETVPDIYRFLLSKKYTPQQAKTFLHEGTRLAESKNKQ